jgi:ABC-type branched-subunit amino acid transport system substrate-binding protein
MPGATPTFKIGLVAPFEGLHRPLGYEALFAVKLAIQERNAGNGLHGYRVELVALNDFDEPTEAKVQARAIVVDPDVVGVVGHLSSASTRAALPIYQAANLAVSIPWSIDASELNPAGVILVAADYAIVEAQLRNLAQTQGLSRLETITRPALNQISSEADALLLQMDGVAAGELLVASAQMNSAPPLFGHVEVGSPQLVQVAKTAANGLIFASPGPAPADIADGAAFREAYQALAGFPPGPRAVLTYDATQILLDTIAQLIQEKERLPARFEVAQRLPMTQRQGLSGTIAFDAHQRRIDAPIWFYQISQGQYPGELLK